MPIGSKLRMQYYGWALKNRAALMPTMEQIEQTSRIVEEAEGRLKGILAIDYVVPDYYALRPKKCMGGWGGSSSTSHRPEKFCHAMRPKPSRAWCSSP
jgi:hypothetical protein